MGENLSEGKRVQYPIYLHR